MEENGFTMIASRQGWAWWSHQPLAGPAMAMEPRRPRKDLNGLQDQQIKASAQHDRFHSKPL